MTTHFPNNADNIPTVISIQQAKKDITLLSWFWRWFLKQFRGFNKSYKFRLHSSPFRIENFYLSDRNCFFFWSEIVLHFYTADLYSSHVSFLPYLFSNPRWHTLPDSFSVCKQAGLSFLPCSGHSPTRFIELPNLLY